ncbi:MAG TPA: CARDB domain-containing protein, partial [Candidatus Manganitrophaceae bacterium]|nr:CARDB domain-containing protein [Candidatus Manganitrophaceae bacterium]
MNRNRKGYSNLKAFGRLLFVFVGIAILAWGRANAAYAIPVGTVLTDLGGRDGARSVAIQPDGKIVAVGFKYNPSGFALARYHSDGKLDTSFGSGGIVVTTDWFGDTAEANGVAVQGDGKIVVTGFTGDTLSFAVARYNPDGSLDAGFGVGGRVVTELSGGYDYDLAYSPVIQSDGKIVVGGFCDCLTGRGKDFALVRYQPDGSFDASFGSGGVVLTDFNNGSDDRIKKILLDTTGKILAGGVSGGNFALARYNPDGSLDTGFGTGGQVTLDFEGISDEVRGLAFSGGKIVVAGIAGPGADIGLARFSGSGVLDRKFGNGGAVLVDMGTYDITSALVIQTDGRIVVGGYSDSFFLARFTANGALDNLFDGDGKVYTNLGSTGDFSYFLGLALQTDGRIVAAGNATTNNGNFALARYNTNGSLDSTFGPRADLAVTSLAAGPNPVKAGETLTYTLDVTNNGPDPAPNVQIGNQFSLSATLVSCSPSCNLGTLSGGASASVTVTVIPLRTGTLTNTVSATSINLADPDAANNSAAASVTVNGTAELAVAMTASPNPAKIAQNLTYAITVTNNGPDKATLVAVADTLPTGVTLVSATSSQGSCLYGVPVTCDIGTLNPGGAASVSIVVKPTANGTLSNTADASTGVTDPNGANNSATANVTVNSAADLALTVSDTPDPVRVGNNITYTVTVTNSGPDIATNVYVQNRFSGEAAVLGFGTCLGGNYSPSYLNCGVGSINPGASATATFEVSTNATGTVTNTATTGSDIVPDPNTANNSVTATTVITGSADLSLTMTDSPDPVLVGTNLTYTMTVTNHGPDFASNAWLDLYLPSSVTVVSTSTTQGNCWSFGTPANCFFGTISSGTTVTVTFVVTPMASGSISTTANARSDIADPNPGNNSATADTTVTGTADI